MGMILFIPSKLTKIFEIILFLGWARANITNFGILLKIKLGF